MYDPDVLHRGLPVRGDTLLAVDFGVESINERWEAEERIDLARLGSLSEQKRADSRQPRRSHP